jgi:hypothetical protein
MSEFEDNLWLDVVREHGDELARVARPVRTRKRAIRPRLLAGTTVGAAAIAIAAASLLGASTSPPAFAVTRNPDGTVTVSLRQLSGIAGANEKLAAMGVPARIAGMAKTAPPLVCPGGIAPTVTFDPAGVPRGQVIMITPADDAAAPKGNPGGSNTSIGTDGRAAGGNTAAGAISNGANQVVHTHPGGAKIRTDSGDGNHVARMYCP